MMKKEKSLSAVFACLGMGAMILDSRCAYSAAKEGLELCLKTVVPSLFPFLFLSAVITAALWGQELKLLRPAGKLLCLPDGSESLLISAFLGGYPAGAQSVGDAYRAGLLSRAEAERLLAFVNNAGPSFLFGMTAMHFPKLSHVWALWGIQLMSAVFVARLHPSEMDKPISLPEKEVTLSSCLTGVVKTMGYICGWIVLFRILLGFVQRWFLWRFPVPLQTAAAGLLELSLGCCSLGTVTNFPLRFLLCCGILSFGGLCVAMQTAAVTQGLSLKPYFRGKVLQTGFSLILGLLWLWEPAAPTLFLLAVPFFGRVPKKRGGNQVQSVV